MWLEVTYEGLAPPTDLFGDLELIGWAPPTLAPPPHEAIDWSRPNDVTGARFTLRDYTVEGAVVQPPAGSASRSTWTDAERASHVAALTRVLGRHGSVEVDDPGALVSAPTLAAPAPPPPAASPRSPSPSPSSSPAAFRPSADATAVLITAPLKPSLAPRAEDVLIALGVTVVFDSQERVKTERYRGSNYETTVTELHLAAIAAPDQLDAVVAELHAIGLVLTFAEVDDASVAPDRPAEASVAPGARTTAAEPAAVHRRDIGLAGVIALADPRTADAVAAVIRSLGLVDASVTRTTRTEISSYRGSRSEREVPTIRIEAWVPEPHARLVATHLAEATHLRVDDISRLWIEAPAPVSDPIADIDPTADIEAAAGLAAPTGVAGVAHAGTPLPPPPSAAAPAVLDPGALIRRPDPAFVDHAR